MNYQRYQFVQRTCSRRRCLFVLRIHIKSAKICTNVIFLPTILQPSLQWPARSMEYSYCEPNLYTERLISSGKCKVTQSERHLSNWNMSMFCSSVTPSNSSALYVCNCHQHTFLLLYNYFRGFTAGSQASISHPCLEMFPCGDSSHITY